MNGDGMVRDMYFIGVVAFLATPGAWKVCAILWGRWEDGRFLLLKVEDFCAKGLLLLNVFKPECTYCKGMIEDTYASFQLFEQVISVERKVFSYRDEQFLYNF